MAIRKNLREPLHDQRISNVADPLGLLIGSAWHYAAVVRRAAGYECQPRVRRNAPRRHERDFDPRAAFRDLGRRLHGDRARRDSILDLAAVGQAMPDALLFLSLRSQPPA